MEDGQNLPCALLSALWLGKETSWAVSCIHLHLSGTAVLCQPCTISDYYCYIFFPFVLVMSHGRVNLVPMMSLQCKSNFQITDAFWGLPGEVKSVAQGHFLVTSRTGSLINLCQALESQPLMAMLYCLHTHTPHVTPTLSSGFSAKSLVQRAWALWESFP